MSARNFLLAGGLVAFLIAGLSIGDMYRSRPSDGVFLEADAPGSLMVREVVAGSGADRAGIRPGDRILGIDRNVLHSTGHAALLLNTHEIGETVPYLVRGGSGLREAWVELGPRRIGSLSYFYACVLGFLFFFVGLFVLERQPRQRAAQVFFILCTLFFLFLVCRLRPASYSWIDTFVLTTGMMALLFLPAAFLHFFLIFPTPHRWRPRLGEPNYRERRQRWTGLLAAIYLLPPVVFLGGLAHSRATDRELVLISGAPAANWWMLAAYVVAGLILLAMSARRVDSPRLRRGAILVLFGSLFGLVPFLVTAVAFPSFLHTEKFLFYGVGPLVLVPLTFAYAIVVFRLMDVRVILQKSLLYGLTTAVVTALYALGIAAFNLLTRGTALAASPFFPIVFALVIVLLFDPLRRRIQNVVKHFVYAERGHLQQAIAEMGDAFGAQADLQPVVKNLVETLPERLDLHFTALYLPRDPGSGTLHRIAGPEFLPASIPIVPEIGEALRRGRGLVRLDELELLDIDRSGVLALGESLRQLGVHMIGGLATQRRDVGVVLFSEKIGQLAPDRSEIRLLRRLMSQASLALETSMLLEERTQQAELERELEIASSVQADLLPESLKLAPGWSVAALCRPARHVGGDFFAELPGPEEGSNAVVYGDVAGKSVSGALVMMAAYEVLNSLALIHRDPEILLGLANRRLYGLGKRKSFVAMAYLAPSPGGGGLQYLLAGQPQPLLRSRDGEVRELDLPENRIPLGALNNGEYRSTHVPMRHGDVVLGYSDGVVDALSARGETFGAERLIQAVAEAPGDPRALVDSLAGILADFTRGTEPYDDLTLVAIRCDQEVTR